MKRQLALIAIFLLLCGGAFAQKLESFAPIVKKVESAVVNVSTTQKIKAQRPFPFDFFREFFGEDPFGGQKQQDMQRQSLGSGVIISPDGYILTNNHVVKDAAGASAIKIRLYGSKEDIEAKIIGKDPKIDIALLKIETKGDLPYAPLGDSDILEVGDWVIAIGNPFGLSHTVTKGIVSAKGRVIGSGPYDDFIQTDTPINFGNSGGPLFNASGEVIGINTAIVSGGQNIGFAIPINMIKTLVPQLKEGKVVRPRLGVRTQEITKEMSESYGLDKTEGALVAEVVKGSPAEKANIREEDIIIEVNGKRVADNAQLPKMIAAFQPKQKIKIKLVREKKEMEVEVTLDQQGDQADAGSIYEKLGLRLSDTKNGILVEDVSPYSISAGMNISPGDYILKINTKKVETVQQLSEEFSKLKANAAVTLHLRTKMGSKFVSFRMP